MHGYTLDNLLNYNPAELTFSITPHQQATTHLTLVNLSPDPVAYKVKTTHPRRYCVRPNIAVLSPAGTIVVELVQQAFTALPADLDDCSDRFQLQAVSLNDIPGLDYDAPPAEVWACAPKRCIRSVKFPVRLEAAESVRSAEPIHASSSSAEVPGESERVAAVVTTVVEEVELSPQETAAVLTSPPQAPAIRPAPPSPPRAPVPVVPAPLVTKLPAFSPRVSVRAEPPAPPAETDKEVAPPAAAAVPAPTKTMPDDIQVRSASPAAASTPARTPVQAPTEPTSAVPAALASMASPLAALLPGTPGTQSSSTAAPVPPKQDKDDVDYSSVAWARERALGVRQAPKVVPPAMDQAARQRVAVERAGELVRVINDRQRTIDSVNRDLTEAQHKLADARSATRPAYDVRYEVNESMSVPFAQICIMAVISGALLQLLV